MHSPSSAIFFALSLLLVGCTREVAGGLDEPEANRAVVALSRAGIEAEKSIDPNAEGRFQIVVSRDDASSAIAVLTAEELPRARAPAPKDPGFVSSPEAERAARIAAIASQIERTLASVDGVLDARVQLDVPATDALAAALAPADANAPRPTASVLLRHRGATPPLVADDVRRLVSGGVSGLDPHDVAVVFVPVTPPAIAADRQIAYLGPIGVTRASLAAARAIAIGAFALIALLGATIVALAVRARRGREQDSPNEPATAPKVRA